MKKLDFHVHCNDVAPEKTAAFAALCRQENVIAALSGGERYGSHDYAPNETVLEICRKFPDCFIPLVKFDLWDKADSAQVWRYKDMGARALKFIYPYYEYDHDLYMPVYEAAEQCDIPVLFHTGNFRPSEGDAIWKRPVLKNMNPLNLDRIARSFPKLRVVMAHLGTSVWRHLAAELLKMHPNLYADLAGSGSWKCVTATELTNLLKKPLEMIDPEFTYFRQLIFGSDAYFTHPHLVMEAANHYQMLLERCGVPENIRNEVMGGTIAKWLNIDLQD